MTRSALLTGGKKFMGIDLHTDAVLSNWLSGLVSQSWD